MTVDEAALRAGADETGPTPPEGRRARLPVRIVRSVGKFLAELVGDAVVEALLVVLTTASLALVLVVAQLLYLLSPWAAAAAAVLTSGVLVHGVRLRRRPERPRGRAGRLAAFLPAALACWMLLCLCFASLGGAVRLASYVGL